MTEVLRAAPRLVPGFNGQLVGVIRVLQRPLSMPASGYTFPFFVMFGGSAMGLRREFVQFGGFAVFLVHGVSSLPPICTRRTNRKDRRRYDRQLWDGGTCGLCIRDGRFCTFTAAPAERSQPLPERVPAP